MSRSHGPTVPPTVLAAVGVTVLVLASGGGGGPLLASLGAIGALMTAMSLVMVLERRIARHHPRREDAPADRSAAASHAHGEISAAA